MRWWFDKRCILPATFLGQRIEYWLTFLNGLQNFHNFLLSFSIHCIWPLWDRKWKWKDDWKEQMETKKNSVKFADLLLNSWLKILLSFWTAELKAERKSYVIQKGFRGYSGYHTCARGGGVMSRVPQAPPPNYQDENSGFFLVFSLNKNSHPWLSPLSNTTLHRYGRYSTLSRSIAKPS